MRKMLGVVGLLALALSLVVPALTGFADADARPRGMKFFVVDWRLNWTDGSDELTLTLKGRTRGKSGSLGQDFQMETTEVKPVLDILRTCAMGRLTGTAEAIEDDDGNFTGEKLTSLSCRAILK